MRQHSTYCFEVTVHQIFIVITLLNEVLDLTSFLDNSSYIFFLIGLKHGGQLDYKAMQCILLQGNTTPNFDIELKLF